MTFTLLPNPLVDEGSGICEFVLKYKDIADSVHHWERERRREGEKGRKEGRK
jgi:hypothetical protein